MMGLAGESKLMRVDVIVSMERASDRYRLFEGQKIKLLSTSDFIILHNFLRSI